MAYLFNYYTAGQFDWTDTDGTTYHETVSPGDQLAVDDPCSALALLNGAIASGAVVAGNDETEAAIDSFSSACAATPGGSSTLTPPPPPPPVVVPPTPATDTPPPGRQETAQTLDAPDAGPGPPVQVDADERPPGTLDSRPLSQQVYDPRNPLPVTDVVGALQQGLSPDQVDAGVQSILHNDPPDGGVHPQFGRDDTEPPATFADPVILFTGAFTVVATDVQIPSRGFPITLTRSYRSGTICFGPWGYNWDHSYNVYLRELDDGGAAIWTGALSEDAYALNPDGTYEPPVGIFGKLEHQATPLGDRWVLADPMGTQQVFERPAGWPLPDRLPMVRIEDRYGNAHVLAYDAEGRLATVTDHAGRRLEFRYGDCGLLEEVGDHTGRRWRYVHDFDVEHLIAVVSPSALEHPDGLITRYEYDRDQDHPALRHNLTRVIDPAGLEVVENAYGCDPATDDFGRVVRQSYGGFEAGYTCTPLQFVPRTPDAINVPARRVEVVECGLQVHTFNYRGDLLDHRFRLVRDGSYRVVARAFRYDEQGNCTESRESNGLGLIRIYDVANADPRGRGNVLRVSLSAPPTRPSPGRELTRFTYDARYQRIKTARDERGAQTVYVYDYEISRVDTGTIVRIEHPDVTLPDGTAQSATEAFDHNAFGQLIERRSAEGHRFTYEYYAGGPSDGYLQRTTAGAGVEDQAQTFDYDVFGNVSGVTNAGGATTTYEHNALGELVRLRKPAVDGVTGDVVYGYASDGRLGTLDTPRGDYDDDTITDGFIRHEFTYDVLGHLATAVYGANTAQPRRWTFSRTSTGEPRRIVDPLGRVVSNEYDERQLPLRHTLFPHTAQERSARLAWDRNGKLVRATDAAGRRLDYAYDAWDRPRTLELPGLAGARTTIGYTYGDRDELERCVTRGVARPGGPIVVLEQRTQHCDERGRLVARALGGVSEERWHDRDGNLVRSVDQRGGSTLTVCDALGRATQITDPAGNEQVRSYDTDGDLTAIVETELAGGAAAGTFSTGLDYDARGQLRRIVDPLGNATDSEYDDRGVLRAVTSPAGLRTEYAYDVEGRVTASRSIAGPLRAAHAWRRDAGGRVLEYVDPEGSATAYEYDGEDRWTAIVTPDGRRRERGFNGSGELEIETAPSGTTSRLTYGPDGAIDTISWMAAAGTLPVPDLQYGRDGLGRAVQLTQGPDTVVQAYDALGRLASETHAGATVGWDMDDIAGTADLSYRDGRVDRYGLDVLGRVERIELRTLGTPAATGVGLAAGETLARYEYTGPGRVARRTLANGCVTDYHYDQGRRLAAIEHRDGAAALLARDDYVHDADGARRFAGTSPVPGAAALARDDSLQRLTGFTEGFAAPVPPAAPTQAAADAYVAALGTPAGLVEHEYTVDRADLRSQAVVDEGGVVSTDDYATDAAHRITTLTRTAAGASATFAYEFDPDGRCVRDHRHRYRYDAMGRLRVVEDLAGAPLMTQDYDAVGRLATRSTGGAAEVLRYFGFRAVEAETGAGVLQRCLGLHPDEIVVESGGGDRWAHQDARLSLLALSDSAGLALERYSYAPFGTARIWAPDGVTPRPASAVGAQPIFGGHRLTGIAGLYDSRARAYDADTGRFLQRDPRGYASGPNPYAYVRHQPVDLTDPSGEILPIIAAIVIVGALVGVGYSFYEASDHPERYSGSFSFRALFNTGAGALVGGVSALGGEAVLASAGLSSFASGGAATVAGAGGAGTLTLAQGFVLSGTTSAVGGLIWRAGFNDLFPEYEAPPSAGTMATDYAFGGVLSVGFRAVEAVGNPFSRAGWNTIRMTVAEARVQAQVWWNQVAGRGARAEQLGRDIAEIRVARLHAGELQDLNVTQDSLAFRIPGEGQRVVWNPEVDVVVDSAWIQVKASGAPGRAAGFGLAQAEYTAWGSPTGRSIFYVEPGVGYPGVARDLLRAGVSEVRPLTPGLRGTAPFPLPFRGLLGLPAARVPWLGLVPDQAPSGGSTNRAK